MIAINRYQGNCGNNCGCDQQCCPRPFPPPPPPPYPPYGVIGPTGPQGVQGIQGVPGNDGKDAYEAALDGGYQGTETQFNAALAQMNGFALAEEVVPKTRKINGLDLSADRTLTGENITVSATDPTPISGAVKYRTNPNLLDNWYFGRPVNQRGQTEYTAAGYTVDRWKLDVGGAVTLEDGCICLKKSGTYWGEYFADFDQFIGMTLTGSVLLSDGTLRTGSFVYNGSVNQAQTFFSSELGFYIQKLSNSQTQCEINSLVDNVKIKAAKLELGDTQTLAHKENEKWVLNEIPDFGDQLARCQRYYRRWTGADNKPLGVAVRRESKLLELVFSLDTAMRVAPSLTFNGSFVCVPTFVWCSVTSIDVGTPDTVAVFLKPNDDATFDLDAYQINIALANEYIALSADL